MNDGLRTVIFLRFTCEAIAAACIYLALGKLEISLPDWWDCLNLTEATLQEICVTILALYERPVRYLQDLEDQLAIIRGDAPVISFAGIL